MNAITQTRRIDQPEAGFFKLKLVRKGPFVAAAIDHRLGFWSASIMGEGCGARHPDPWRADGLERVWTTGQRIDAHEYLLLLANPPASPRLPIDLGAMPPINFETREPTTMNAIAGIGHNNAPLIDLAAALEPRALADWISVVLEPHTARANLITASYSRFLTATAGGIASADVDERAVDFANQIRKEIAALDATRVGIKAPVLVAQKMIDGAAKTISDTLLPAFTEVQRRHTAYLVAEDTKARRIAAEQAELLHQESQRAAIEATRMEAAVQRLLDEAAETGDQDTMEAAIVASTEHEAALATSHAAAIKRDAATMIELAPTADLTRVRTANQATSALKDCWTYTIEDLGKVPVHLLMINDKAVKAAIQGGSRNIPGLTIRNTPKASIR